VLCNWYGLMTLLAEGAANYVISPDINRAKCCQFDIKNMLSIILDAAST